MTRNEYCEQVLANLRRLTVDEREAVRAELDAHMEDHICALLDLGYDEQLAEERTLARMGDPAEVGRELDKQYPLRWLVLGRIAVVLTTLMCITAVLGIGILFHFWDSLTARIDPPRNSSVGFLTATEELDIRIPIGNDILVIGRISTGVRGEDYVAELVLCNYDRIPGGIASENIINHVYVANQRGEVRWDGGRGGGGGSYGAVYGSRCADIERGDTYVTVTYDAYGERFELELPLPQEEVLP